MKEKIKNFLIAFMILTVGSAQSLVSMFIYVFYVNCQNDRLKDKNDIIAESGKEREKNLKKKKEN